MNKDVLQILKAVEYMDTAIQMALRNEWGMVGLVGAQFIFALLEGFIQLV